MIAPLKKRKALATGTVPRETHACCVAHAAGYPRRPGETMQGPGNPSRGVECAFFKPEETLAENAKECRKTLFATAFSGRAVSTDVPARVWETRACAVNTALVFYVSS